jgi:hypothetical protein
MAKVIIINQKLIFAEWKYSILICSRLKLIIKQWIASENE